MEIFASLVSFVVALVGIHGKTWNAQGKGFRKLTRTGWITAVCALLALVFAITTELFRRDEDAKARAQRETINQIALMEICLAAADLKIAIDTLMSVATHSLNKDGSDIGRTFAELEDKSALDQMEKFDVLSSPIARPSVGDQRVLDAFVSEYSKSFIAKSNIALAKYSTFLEGDIILKSTWLINHNFVRRLVAFSEQVGQLKINGKMKYPALWPAERNEYLEALALLKSVFEMSQATNSGLVCKIPDFFKKKQ